MASNSRVDPIIQAVIDYTQPHKNTAYQKKPPIKLAQGCYYVVIFTGEDHYQRAHYVYEKRDRRYVYDDLSSLIQEHGRHRAEANEKYVLTVIMGLGWLAVIAAVIAVAVNSPDSKAFQALSGLAGTITGYLIAVLAGKTPPPVGQQVEP